ncbi:hypothetical protein ACFQH8_17785 [Halomicroarcula sp. GCM10025710]
MPGVQLGTLAVGSGMVAGVGALGLAGYLYRHRSSPGVRWFLLSFLGVALWCLAYSSGLLVFDRSLRVHQRRCGSSGPCGPDRCSSCSRCGTPAEP